jgi:hypothetical protein
MQNTDHWTEQTGGDYRLVGGRVQHAEHWPLDGTDSWGAQGSGREGNVNIYLPIIFLSTE